MNYPVFAANSTREPIPHERYRLMYEIKRKPFLPEFPVWII